MLFTAYTYANAKGKEFTVCRTVTNHFGRAREQAKLRLRRRALGGGEEEDHQHRGNGDEGEEDIGAGGGGAQVNGGQRIVNAIRFNLTDLS